MYKLKYVYTHIYCMHTYMQCWSGAVELRALHMLTKNCATNLQYQH